MIPSLAFSAGTQFVSCLKLRHLNGHGGAGLAPVVFRHVLRFGFDAPAPRVAIAAGGAFTQPTRGNHL
jgi:hypothetical protein